MRAAWIYIRDGIVTGLVGSVLLTLPCLIVRGGLPMCGEWIFVVGVALAFLSGVWTIAGYYSPPGVLGLLSGDVEIYPSAEKDSVWVDRFISPRNTWLVAGATMVLTAFLPPFLQP